jgi:hypothetical protein
MGRAARLSAEQIDWEVVHDAFEAALREVIDGRPRVNPAEERRSA